MTTDDEIEAALRGDTSKGFENTKFLVLLTVVLWSTIGLIIFLVR